MVFSRFFRSRTREPLNGLRFFPQKSIIPARFEILSQSTVFVNDPDVPTYFFSALLDSIGERLGSVSPFTNALSQQPVSLIVIFSSLDATTDAVTALLKYKHCAIMSYG